MTPVLEGPASASVQIRFWFTSDEARSADDDEPVEAVVSFVTCEGSFDGWHVADIRVAMGAGPPDGPSR